MPGGNLPGLAVLAGPVLLGYLFNWGLFGALTVQCYIYYIAFPKDHTYLKMVVAFTYTIELLQTIMITVDAFRQFGAGWGNPAQLNDVGLLWFSVSALDGIISASVQHFFAWRIYALSGNFYISIVVVLLALTQGVFAIYSGVLEHIVNEPSKIQSTSFRPTIVWLGGTALCDIIITTSMVFFLQQARRNSGVKSTANLLTRLTKLTFETGMACASFAIVDLTLFLRFQHNNLHLLPALTLCKLYSNSLLVVFNSRLKIQGGRNTGEDTTDVSTWSVSTSMHQRMTGQTSFTATSRSKGGIPTRAIAVEVNRTQDRDVSDIELSRVGETTYTGSLGKDGRTLTDSFEASYQKPKTEYVV
ncbi:hypothetical protein EUX98_g4286 [Antrodiella citrinella]|uniref:DUF6534 domain-containing protein n=1 Tax=Antrodiella citrinella TaxID=2447956 RepID=A0A4S4MWU6_9APHY|nr:hypothetical protein EUX98_g4286 [Antrodiella citrinella]